MQIEYDAENYLVSKKNVISKFSLHIFEPISTLTIICQIGFLGAG